MAFTDWSTTNSSNTAVGPVNIAEGCPPGNLNDAIREVMAELAAFFMPAAGGGVAVTAGGTGATTAAQARTNLGAAASGANADITSLTGLTTPLAGTEGGTGMAGVQSTLSAGLNGYFKTYSGLILQWGFASALTNQALNTITFPAAFPSSCFAMFAGLASGIPLTSSAISLGAAPISASQGRIAVGTASPGTTGAYWLAIGI